LNDCASFVATPKAKADTAPGEGYYTGAFVGYGTGILSAKGPVLQQLKERADAEYLNLTETDMV
jgi:hypothetical protein